MFLLILNGCSLVAPNESEVFLARQGLDADVVDDKLVDVIQTDDGKMVVTEKATGRVIIEGKVSKMQLRGRAVIDRATLDYYKKLHEMFGKEYLKIQAQEKLNK